MPNFFTMKMRCGTNAPDDSNRVAAFVSENHCIGIGDPEYTSGFGVFQNNIQIGDIIVLRAGGRPLALLEVTSNMYPYRPNGEYPDFDSWIVYVRDINVLSWYSQIYEEDSSIEFDARGYMHTCAAIVGEKLCNIQKWYNAVVHDAESMALKLQQKNVQKDEPNIFSFATSELSQDAMFAWIIQWADPQYSAMDSGLNTLAQNFVRMLMGKDSSFVINSIDVGRQWQNIDIWAEINDDCFLIIEDKTNTSIHDDQLQRYKKEVEDEYEGKRSNLFFAYVKTGNEPESIINQVKKYGFLPVSRKDILDCLNTYTGKNAIVTSYRQSLQRIEDETQSYQNLPVDKWCWNAWQGFYKALEKSIGIDSWGYVANPAGGFLGAWWFFLESGLYLQFEQGKLCFKVNCEEEEKENRSSRRDKCMSTLLDIAQRNKFAEIKKPERKGTGAYMTIAIVGPQDFFGNEVIPMESVVDKLKRYQDLLTECDKELIAEVQRVE